MFAETPNNLGSPGPLTQTTYYLGQDCLASREDINAISSLMEDNAILPENTRLKKHRPGKHSYGILQASVEESEHILESKNGPPAIDQVQLVRGDHKEELQRVCRHLQEAKKYVSNATRHRMLEQTHYSFLTGNLEAYKDAQRTWVNDKAPAVETVLGFVEPYRDPLGVRGEYEGIVGITDVVETRRLHSLANVANQLVCRLPWVKEQGTSKGPFEKELFEPPDFSSVQSKYP